MTAFVEGYRVYLIMATFAFLGFAFYMTYRPQAGGRLKPTRMMKMNRAMLWIVTILALAFLFVPEASQRLFATGNTITSDMHRTVIHVEGMT